MTIERKLARILMQKFNHRDEKKYYENVSTCRVVGVTEKWGKF